MSFIFSVKFAYNKKEKFMRLSNIQPNLYLTGSYRGKFEKGAAKPSAPIHHRPDGTNGFNRADFQQVMGVNESQRKVMERQKAQRQSAVAPRKNANKNVSRQQSATHPQNAKAVSQRPTKNATRPNHKTRARQQQPSPHDIYRNNRLVKLTAGVLAATVATGTAGYVAGNAKGYSKGLEAGEKTGYSQAYDESEKQYASEMDAAINAAIDEYKEEMAQTFKQDAMEGLSEAADIPLSLLKLANNFKANGDPKENLNLASTVVPHEKTTFPYRVASEELFIGHQEERQLLAQAQKNLARVFSDGDEFSDNGFIYLTAKRDTTMGELKNVFGIVDGALARAKVNGLEDGARGYVGNSYEKDGAIVPEGDTIRIKINDNANAACPGLQFGVYKNHKEASADEAQLKAIRECANK